MRRKLSISDFDYTPAGYGQYKVTYSNSRRSWTAVINNTDLIDNIRGFIYPEQPKQSDLIALRREVLMWANDKSKSRRIDITDFRFERLSGYHHYRVSYTSPKTGKTWTTVINDALIISKTWQEDEPKIKDLNDLKKIVKTKAERESEIYYGYSK